MPSIEKKESGLKKSLGLIFVYTVATGSIFTYVSYWDSVFFSYCGAGTFLAFALMTLAILPVALVYSELSPLFHTSGGELIYNTVGMNKHVGFLASWLIMAAWISVPPAVCMAIATFFKEIFGLAIPTIGIVGIGVVILLLVFAMSMQNITFLVKVQAFCLFANIATTLLTAVLVLTSGHWSISNLAGMFNFSNIETTGGIPGWIIGMALLITPYFGFETVPQMVEEGDFPISNTKKAICGSVLTCGVIYAIFFFCVAGLDKPAVLLADGVGDTGFMTIRAMQNLLGWRVWPMIYAVISVLLGMTASILGFWMSTVRMMYSMGKKNFLPKAFTYVNRHQQPILPNIFLLGISLIFILLMNAGSFMNSFFNLHVLRLRLRLCHHHDLGCADSQEAPRMVCRQQESGQGRQLHPLPGHDHHDRHRLLLHPGPGQGLLDLLWHLPGHRRLHQAVDGAGTLEEVQGGHRYPRRLQGILSSSRSPRTAPCRAVPLPYFNLN